jgi:hypothetical protein
MAPEASHEWSGTSAPSLSDAQRKRAVRLCTVQVAAGALLFVAVTLLPMATYKALSTDTTTFLRGGSLSLAVGVAAAASIALSLMGLRFRSSPAAVTNVAIGCAAMIGSIALALSNIAAATDLAAVPGVGGTGGTETSYAVGSLVALLASLVLVLSGVNALSTLRVDPS